MGPFSREAIADPSDLLLGDLLPRKHHDLDVVELSADLPLDLRLEPRETLLKVGEVGGRRGGRLFPARREGARGKDRDGERTHHASRIAR